MSKRLAKIPIVLLGLLLLVYIGYQVYMVIYPSYNTEIALMSTVSDSVEVNGIVVRDETLISTEPGMTTSFLVSDGDKIASGASVAGVYGSSSGALNAIRLAASKRELAAIQSNVESGRSLGANIYSISDLANSALRAVSKSLSYEKYSAATAGRDELASLLYSFYSAAGNSIDLSARSAALEAQIASLDTTESQPVGTITAPCDGYFISSADGYEGLVNTQSVYEMSAQDIQLLVSGQTAAQSLNEGDCKVVSDYKWLFAAIVDDKTAARLAVGDSVSLDFSYDYIDGLPMKVRAVKQGADGINAAILQCNYLNSSMADIRLEEARINFRSYTGLKVPRSALRLKENVLGVYVKYGSTVQFRELDVVYETDDFVLSASAQGDSQRLSLYDEMITEGKDIYEGKELGKVSIR